MACARPIAVNGSKTTTSILAAAQRNPDNHGFRQTHTFFWSKGKKNGYRRKKAAVAVRGMAARKLAAWLKFDQQYLSNAIFRFSAMISAERPSMW